jgi:hypothetical protein
VSPPDLPVPLQTMRVIRAPFAIPRFKINAGDSVSYDREARRLIIARAEHADPEEVADLLQCLEDGGSLYPPFGGLGPYLPVTTGPH